MTLHLLAAGFALVMLLRHGAGARRFLLPGLPAAERKQALRAFLAAAMAILLFSASVRLYLSSRP